MRKHLGQAVVIRARTVLAPATLLLGVLAGQHALAAAVNVPLYFPLEGTDLKTTACATYTVQSVRKRAGEASLQTHPVMPVLRSVLGAIERGDEAELIRLSTRVGGVTPGDAVKNQIRNYLGQAPSMTVESVDDIFDVQPFSLVMISIRSKASGRVSPATMLYSHSGGQTVFLPDQPASPDLSLILRWYLSNRARGTDPLADQCAVQARPAYRLPLAETAERPVGGAIGVRGFAWGEGDASAGFTSSVDRLLSALAAGNAAELANITSAGSLRWLQSSGFQALRSERPLQPVFWFDLGALRVLYAKEAASGRMGAFVLQQDGEGWIAKGLGTRNFGTEIFSRTQIVSKASDSPPFRAFVRP